MPSRPAASDWDSEPPWIRSRIRWTRSAFTRAMSGFASRRSAKTFPLPRSMGVRFRVTEPFLVLAPAGIVFLRSLQARLDPGKVLDRRLDSSSGFLLEGMEHVHHARELDCVNRAIGVAIVVLDDL